VLSVDQHHELNVRVALPVSRQQCVDEPKELLHDRVLPHVVIPRLDQQLVLTGVSVKALDLRSGMSVGKTCMCNNTWGPPGTNLLHLTSNAYKCLILVARMPKPSQARPRQQANIAGAAGLGEHSPLWAG
jgi:hypothetical protein